MQGLQYQSSKDDDVNCDKMSLIVLYADSIYDASL